MNRLPLTKCWDEEDDLVLVKELRYVDRYFTAESEQGGVRRWEYALALKALEGYSGGILYDVGGAGSPFAKIVGQHHAIPWVIDPAGGTKDLAGWVRESHPPLGNRVFCLSVIEHVEDLQEFLYHLGCLVAPGGRLFLTFDYWDKGEEDRAHLHWMRKRIFHPGSWEGLAESFKDFSFLGGSYDLTWHGPFENWGYAAASLALEKRR